MNGMQWITLAMYVIVVAIWISMLVRVLRKGKAVSGTTKRNLTILSAIVLALTAMQFLAKANKGSGPYLTTISLFPMFPHPAWQHRNRATKW